MKKHFAPSKPLSILAGVSLFILCALPFTLFRAQIQEMAALGYAGLFAACALSNVSVFLPSSSTMFVLLASSALHPAVCVLVGGLGSALGEQSAYLCGRAGFSAFHCKESAAASRILVRLRQHSFWAVFLFALAPLPVFDLAGVAAGADRMPWTRYTLAAFLGKTLRFALTLCFAQWAAENLNGVIGSLYDALL